jgi:hypothetical protein
VRQEERLSILRYVLSQVIHSPLRFLYPVDAAPELTSLAPLHSEAPRGPEEENVS